MVNHDDKAALASLQALAALPADVASPGMAPAYRGGPVSAVEAMTQLRYGTVAVNVLAAGIPTATWGGYPGHPDTGIQSGRGAIGNTLMLPDPEKDHYQRAFRTRPAPAWFATQPGMLPTFRALPSCEAAPTIPKLAGLMRPALRHR